MIWRPPQEIRVKVVAIARRGDAFLFVEVRQDDGRIKGLRPHGGSVEFGETREIALIRELKEELGVGARIIDDWIAFENIFSHEGACGHEIIFAAPVAFDAAPGGGAERFAFAETDGAGWARWMRLDDAEREGMAIFPDGLARHLRDQIRISD